MTEQVLFGIDLATLYLVLEAVSLAIALATAVVIKLPQRIMAFVRPVTVTSPVFEVSYFPMLSEQEFSIDYHKQLKGVPIFVQNRGPKPCIVEALWIEPSGRGQASLQKVPIISNYLESYTVAPNGGQVEIRGIPDTPRYLQEICKESGTDFCRICVRALPYGNVRSRKFHYRNWQNYIYAILWGAARRSASVLVRQAAREKKSDKEAVNALWNHYTEFMPEPVTSLAYAKMTLEEEAAKGNVPQTYVDCASMLTEELLKPLKDSIEKAIAEGNFPFPR